MLFKKKKGYSDPDGVFENVRIAEENAKIEEVKNNPKLQRLPQYLRIVNLIRKYEPETLIY